MSDLVKQLFEKIITDEKNRQPQKGGFFPLPNFPKQREKEPKNCNDSEHEPPRYLHIPQGQGYKHICPSCGKVSVVIPPQQTM